jgi:hypothetical protein
MEKLQTYFKIGGKTVIPKRIIYEKVDTRKLIIKLLLSFVEETTQNRQGITIIRSCLEWIRFIHEMHSYIDYTENEPYLLLNLTDDTISKIDYIYDELFRYLYHLDRLGMADSQVYQTILHIRFSAKRYILFRDEPMSAAAPETGYPKAKYMYQTVDPALEKDLAVFLDTYFSDDESEPSDAAETGAAGPLVKKRRKQVQLRL